MDPKVEADERFGDLNVEECLVKGEKMQNNYTINNEVKCTNIFKTYLQSLGLDDVDFFKFTEPKLDHYLTTFWWNARTKKGGEYTASSMETIRYSLNPALMKIGHNYDITSKHSLSFKQSQKAFEDVQKDRKKRGLGVIKKTEDIASEGTYFITLCS